MNNKILITGGAGYIGSHIAKLLLEKKYQVIIVDNLTNGSIFPIQILKKKFNNLIFIKADLNDKERLAEIFQSNQIDSVFHLAAKTDVQESLINPQLYQKENYLNSINLVDTMTLNGVNKLIFSSTAAVYGDPQYTPIDEKHPTKPLNPYGQTKLDFENYLKKVKNLDYIILRYFNVGGSDPDGLIGKSHLESFDLIENIMKIALGQQKILKIFGNNFETSDKTAVRDFIHVTDISEAHILALEKIEELAVEGGNKIFNLGSEKGFTVKEIINKACKVIGKDLPIEIVEKREGDIAISVASSQKARKLLGWKPRYSSLESILLTDWNWRKKHPLGYTK